MIITPALTIDGSPCEYDLAGTMYQTSPYPGGHEYSLVIQVPSNLFDFLEPQSKYEPPDEDTSYRVLSRLTQLLRAISNRPCSFYLNSISTLEVNHDFVLRIKGVCSDAR